MAQWIKFIYCCECSWSVSSAEYTRQERNALIIEHALDTGHDIDSTPVRTDLQPPPRPE